MRQGGANTTPEPADRTFNVATRELIDPTSSSVFLVGELIATITYAVKDASRHVKDDILLKGTELC